MLKGRPLLYTMTALNALSFMLFGYVSCVVIQPKLTGRTKVLSAEWTTAMASCRRSSSTSTSRTTTRCLAQVGHHQQAALTPVVSMYDIGAFIGAVLCSLVGEKIGRRYSLLVGTLVMLVGTAWQAASSSSGVMIGARIFSGIGMVSSGEECCRQLIDRRVSLRQLHPCCSLRSRPRKPEAGSSASSSQCSTSAS